MKFCESESRVGKIWNSGKLNGEDFFVFFCMSAGICKLQSEFFVFTTSQLLKNMLFAPALILAKEFLDAHININLLIAIVDFYLLCFK